MNRKHTEKFAADVAPSFRDKLARDKTVAGWSSPYQSPDSHDGKATTIAKKFIRHFMTGMEEMGYMPYTGVEVNFALYGENNDLDQFLNHAMGENAVARYYASLEVKKRLLRSSGGWPKPHFAVEPDASLNEEVEHLESALERVLAPNVPSDYHDINKLASMVELFDEYIHPDLYNAVSDLVADDMRYTRAGTIPTYNLDEFGGRIYVDGKNMEVATGVADPLSTVRRVNRIKDLAYQSTYDYDHTFPGTKEDLAGESSADHADPIANNIADTFGAINVGFSFDSLGSTGEHLSFSLQRNCAPGESYGLKTRDQSEFKHGNFMNHFNTQQLFRDVFATFLGNDALLSLGNVHDLSKFHPTEGSEGKTHEIIDNGVYQGAHEGTRRVEIRTFNNSSSNVALSMLAVMAVAYATLKEIKRHPDIEVRMNSNDTQDEDVEVIVNEMVRTYGDGIACPYTMNQAVARFRDDSLTLEMMREFVEDNVKDGSERQALFAEIDEFRDNVIKRARDLEREQTRDTKAER